jgi:hypothetical protein
MRFPSGDHLGELVRPVAGRDLFHPGAVDADRVDLR